MTQHIFLTLPFRNSDRKEHKQGVSPQIKWIPLCKLSCYGTLNFFKSSSLEVFGRWNWKSAEIKMFPFVIEHEFLQSRPLPHWLPSLPSALILERVCFFAKSSGILFLAEFIHTNCFSLDAFFVLKSHSFSFFLFAKTYKLSVQKP